MMKEKITFPGGELIFCQLDKNKQISPLKEMQALLKSFSTLRPGEFSHVPADGGPIRNLTIGSNLLLESASGIFDRGCQSLISSLIDREKTPSLHKFLEHIDNFELLASKASDEINKIVGLIRGLTKNDPVLLLDSPESGLSPKCQEILKEAIAEAIEINKKCIIVTSQDTEFWYPRIDKVASRSADFSFTLAPVNNINVIELPKVKKDDQEEQLVRLTA